MTDAATPTPAQGPRRLALAALFAGFALLFAYDLWEAIETLIVAPPTFASLGAPVPWTAFIANAIVPVAVFTLAVLIGRRRPLIERAALLIAGLCLVAVLTLTLTAYVRAGGL